MYNYACPPPPPSLSLSPSLSLLSLSSLSLSLSGDLPLEELLALYSLQRRSGTPDTEVESSRVESSRVETSLSEHWMSSLDHERTALTCCGILSSSGSEDEGEDEASDEEGEEEEGEEEEEEEEEGGGGMELLVEGKTVTEVCRTEEGLSGVAAAAEQFQPKGITLATTEVCANLHWGGGSVLIRTADSHLHSLSLTR